MSKAPFGSVLSSLTAEAFLSKGDPASAREHLREIRRRGGDHSADYTRLAEAIVAMARLRSTGKEQ